MSIQKQTRVMLLGISVAAMLSSNVAFAEVTANAGMFSNYIFRGTTYSGDSAAVQGSVDWTDNSGAYAGAWVSTLGDVGLGGGEIDFYGGYQGKLDAVDYDVGLVTYQYTSTPEFNYTEAYFSSSFSIITLGFNYTVNAASGNEDAAFDQGDLYLFAKADFSAGPVDVSIYAGNYDYANDNKFGNGDISYNHFGVSLSKNGFSLAVDKSDVKETNSAVGGLASNMDAVRFTLSYTVDIDVLQSSSIFESAPCYLEMWLTGFPQKFWGQPLAILLSTRHDYQDLSSYQVGWRFVW